MKKYRYLGYTYVDVSGWNKIVNELLDNLDKLRPWYLPRMLLNIMYYLAYGNSIVITRSRFWARIFDKYIYPKINYLRITDIKEKYGTLRIYYNGGNNLVNLLIDCTTLLSESICYECGSYDSNCEIIPINGWYTNVCTKCRIKYNKKEEWYVCTRD